MFWIILIALTLFLLVWSFQPLSSPFQNQEAMFPSTPTSDTRTSSQNTETAPNHIKTENKTEPENKTDSPPQDSKEQDNSGDNVLNDSPQDKHSGAKVLLLWWIPWLSLFQLAHAQSLPTQPISRSASRQIAQPSVQAPTSKASSKKKISIEVLINDQGQILLQGKVLSLSDWVKQCFQWKTQSPPPKLKLSLSAKAPQNKLTTLRNILRGSQLQWSEHQELPPGHPSKLPWKDVPLAQTGTSTLELRAQILDVQAKPMAFLSTGLVQYQGEKRQALARVKTDAKGLFRYRFSPKPNIQYRVAILSQQGYREFPIPSTSKPVLYLQFKLPKVAPPSLWDKVPQIKLAKTSSNKTVTLHVQIFEPTGKPAGALPTGLLIQTSKTPGRRHKPVGRGLSDPKGRIRYTFDPKPKTTYVIVVLKGSQVHFETVSLKGTKVIPVKIQLKTPKTPLPSTTTTQLMGLSLVVEKQGPQQLLVTQFVALNVPVQGKNTVRFPLPQGATGVQFNKQYKVFRPEFSQGQIINRKPFPPKIHRFAYSYKYPLQKKVSLSFTSALPPQQVALFLSPHLLLRSPQIKPKQVRLGPQKRLLNLHRLPLKKSSKRRQFTLTFEDPSYEPPSFMSWLKRWKNNPKKQNKLIGLVVLAMISFLGLFMALPFRSAQEQEEPSVAEKQDVG